MTEHDLRLENITKDYPSRRSTVQVLSPIDFTVDAGQFVTLIGPSGCGKSTLLSIVAGLVEPSSGSLSLGDAPITGPGRDRGVVFQQHVLLPWLTARENILFALECLRPELGREERQKVAEHHLELVHLSHAADKRPSQLSGGMKQRVGIARALATNPSVLLSDEATSALDPETTASILELLQRLNRELGLTILLITHEMDVVKQICTSAALMQHGRIVESGRLRDLLLTPGSVIARQLFPLGEAPATPGSTVLDLTFTELTAHDPVIARLAREQGLDIGLLGAAIETIDGVQSGRTRLELPEGADVARAIASLREQGIVVEEVAA